MISTYISKGAIIKGTLTGKNILKKHHPFFFIPIIKVKNQKLKEIKKVTLKWLVKEKL